MRFVLYTRLPSAHEMPLFEAMARRCSESVYVVETRAVVEGRVGWRCPLPENRFIVLGDLPREGRAAVWKRLLDEDTLVLFGYRDSEWKETLVASAARVVYAGERWLRPYGPLPGWVRLFSPRFRRTVRWYRRLLAERDNFTVLAQGVHAVRDFGRLGLTKVIPWGYFVSSPGPQVRKLSSAQALRLLWVGRMIPLKHADTLVRAVEGRRDLSVTFVGEGPSRPGLEELVRRAGLSDSVRFLGAVEMSGVRDLMREHDVLVLTSDAREGWGMVVSEALAEGMSVFGTEEAGASATLLPPERRFRCGDWRRLAELLSSPLARRRQSLPYAWTAESAAERLLSLVRDSPSPDDEVAAAFWEEHCTECGEPDCYRTCLKYVKGRGGRCRRFAGGLRETILGEGVEAEFLPWGKMEAFFHGKMISRKRAERLERLADRTSFLRKVSPRWWRSWRWRWALRGATESAPDVWRVKAVAERDECLSLQVVDGDLKELARSALELKGGVPAAVDLPLPPVGDGALFRIFPANGEATGKILFERCQLVRRAAGQYVKCLAWDLDGTLWQGTLAEDGADGLTLNEAAVGLLRELDARGVVNSIASRNDPEPALAALRRFGLEEYFVFPQIGWGPKSDGLRALAREMNIGLESIAFVDDREEVRGEVRANVPEVRVFAADEIPVLGARREFNPPVSAESAGRRLRYREEMVRRGAAKAFAGDPEAFLAASGLEFELLSVEGDRVMRCRELVQRTNQLNLTGRRYDEKSFAALLSEAECRAVRVWDRYGDYGIVGFTALKGTRLVECCFSCRVAEKGVEERVLKEIAAGRKLTADVVETPKNGKIRAIVRELGFVSLNV